MKFKGALVSQLSGAMGGVVASTAKGGLQYFRRRPSAKAVATALQGIVRGILAVLSQRWSGSLTEANRQTWLTYGLNVTKLDNQGNTIHVAGSGWYVGNNLPRLQANEFDSGTLALADSFTGSFDLGNPTALSPGNFTIESDSVGNNTISFNPAHLPITTNTASRQDAVLVYASQPYSAGRVRPPGPFNLVKVINAADIPSATGTVSFSTPSGLIMSGSWSKQDFLLRLTREDGRLSSPFRFNGALS